MCKIHSQGVKDSQRMYDFRVRVEEKKTMYVIKLTKGQF